MVPQRLVVTELDVEVGDHRQVDEGEGHQGTEVDQRQCHLQVERHRREASTPTSSTFRAGVCQVG